MVPTSRLLTDMIICADDALFGFPPARDLGALPNNMWLYNVGPQWAKRLMLTGDSITGAEAQQIGLVLKAVPKEDLEYEVEQLADRLCKIDPDLLSTNKRIINMGLELMGARTLQRMAAENDVRGHNARGGFRIPRVGGEDRPPGDAAQPRRQVRRRTGARERPRVPGRGRSPYRRLTGAHGRHRVSCRRPVLGLGTCLISSRSFVLPASSASPARESAGHHYEAVFCFLGDLPAFEADFG